MAFTQIADVIVPEIFNPYVQNLTTQKSNLIRSGAVAMDALLDDFLSGGGLTTHLPQWKDLDNSEENTSTDDSTNSTPLKTSAFDQVAIRLNRNNSWSANDLATVLAGSDPMNSIAERVSAYWTRRLQALFIATVKGVFADNAAAPTASEHVQNDLTVDIKGASFSAATSFNGPSVVDATLTMGDSMEELSMIMVHSIVYGVMIKKNFIDFIIDSETNTRIPTYLGRRVIVDDSMPFTSGVFESWLFGTAALRLGTGSPAVPTEMFRSPSAGNGAGQDTLHNRVTWSIHPEGHSYIGGAGAGGPTNAATSGNLAHAGSWKRVAPERKQVRIARLITREF